jgi:nucleotide-binding universal stress UspA family protein
MTVKKIMFCTDFSESCIPARRTAIEYAHAFGAELIIFHVVSSQSLGYPIFEERIPFDMNELRRNIEQNVESELEQIVKLCETELGDECSLSPENINAHFRSGEPPQEICDFAEQNAVDLIVIGTHGWKGFRHLILGSTAENVVRMATCPVLTVRSRE